MLSDEDVQQLKDEIETLREALRRIALGDGYYGAMAREYKNIARAALGIKELA